MPHALDPDWDPDVLYSPHDPNPCAQCGTLTHYLELNFETSLCSKGCIDAMWAEYSEACEVSDLRQQVRLAQQLAISRAKVNLNGFRELARDKVRQELEANGYAVYHATSETHRKPEGGYSTVTLDRWYITKN